nr:MAG TPA: hypothetical protein [Caudoviricetes sp.]
MGRADGKTFFQGISNIFSVNHVKHGGAPEAIKELITLCETSYDCNVKI